MLTNVVPAMVDVNRCVIILLAVICAHVELATKGTQHHHMVVLVCKALVDKNISNIDIN